MCAGVDELRDRLDDYDNLKCAGLEQAIASNDWPVLERYIDEEMARALHTPQRRRPDRRLYLRRRRRLRYRCARRGLEFYDGVWDKLYDVCGIRWHE